MDAEQIKTFTDMLLQQSPLVVILLFAVYMMWRRLVDRDKKIEELIERYHTDSQKVSALLDKIFARLDK